MVTHSNDTLNARERILSVAEKVFLEGGFDGVSVRELTEAAGVNVALVNYYFGGKRKLYLEVLHNCFSKEAESKCAHLQQAIDPCESPDLRQIVSAYVYSHLGSDESLSATQSFLRLLTRQLAEDDDAIQLLLQQLVLPVHQLLIRSIKQTCPQLSEQKVSLCITSITGQIVHFIRCPAMSGMLAGISETEGLRQAMAEHIIEFSLKGIKEEPSCA